MNSLERVVNALVNIHPWHTLLVHFPSAFAVVESCASSLPSGAEKSSLKGLPSFAWPSQPWVLEQPDWLDCRIAWSTEMVGRPTTASKRSEVNGNT